jgi:hypothetical protein
LGAACARAPAAIAAETLTETAFFMHPTKTKKREDQMAFTRLQSLGKEKFAKIVNELMRGTPLLPLARLIQQEWGDVENVSQHTLAKQLQRLHTAITNGAFGGDLADQAKRKASVKIKLFHSSALDVLDELITLHLILKERIDIFFEKECESGKYSPGLTKIMRADMDLLVAIQKIKFDLGIDEYKFSIPAVRPAESAVKKQTGRDDPAVCEAYAKGMKIFQELASNGKKDRTN